jgi:hypothetical protein
MLFKGHRRIEWIYLLEIYLKSVDINDLPLCSRVNLKFRLQFIYGAFFYCVDTVLKNDILVRVWLNRACVRQITVINFEPNKISFHFILLAFNLGFSEQNGHAVKSLFLRLRYTLCLWPKRWVDRENSLVTLNRHVEQSIKVLLTQVVFTCVL